MKHHDIKINHHVLNTFTHKMPYGVGGSLLLRLSWYFNNQVVVVFVVVVVCFFLQLIYDVNYINTVMFNIGEGNESTTQLQILKQAVFITFSAMALLKLVNPFINP